MTKSFGLSRSPMVDLTVEAYMVEKHIPHTPEDMSRL